jgi:hypothetical protein
VSTDSAPGYPVAFEVTVPHIVLPSVTSAQTKDAVRADAGEDEEQFALLTAPYQQRDRTPQFTLNTEITPEVTTHATTMGIFRLFRLKLITTSAWLYLIRIQHIQKQQTTRPRTAPGATRQPYTPHLDDLVCTISFTSITDDTSTHRPLTPGRHEVVILLNEEGIPTSYRIDGRGD